MQSLRDYAEGSLVRKEWMRGARWERCSGEVKGKSDCGLWEAQLGAMTIGYGRLGDAIDLPSFAALSDSSETLDCSGHIAISVKYQNTG